MAKNLCGKSDQADGHNIPHLSDSARSCCGVCSFRAEDCFALLWFIAIIAFGAVLTASLASVDRKEYQSKGAYLDHFDTQATRANLLGATGVASEVTDESRQRGDLTSNRDKYRLSVEQAANH